MCGIVGVIAKSPSGFYSAQCDIFEQLLYADTVRGEDSTGVFGVTKNGNISSLKSAQPGYDFIRTDEFRSWRGNMLQRYTVAIGHNRKATKGEIKGENAHPFQEGHIIGVHNGTTWGHNPSDKYEVDSHAIFAQMAKSNNEIETLSSINGAFALVWYNKNDKTLNLCRNSMRPLWLINTSSHWYICSEHGLASWILSRENQRLEGFEWTFKDKDGKPEKAKVTMMLIPEWTQLVFDLKKYNRDEFFTIDIPKYHDYNKVPKVEASADQSSTSSLEAVVEAVKEATNAPDAGKNLPVLAKSVQQVYATQVDYEDKESAPGDIHRGRVIVVKPVDFVEWGDAKKHIKIISEVVSIDGDTFPNMAAHFIVGTDDQEKFLGKGAPQYWGVSVISIRGPRWAHLNKPYILICGGGKGGTSVPIAIKFGISANSKFMSELTFAQNNVTGCRKCQAPLVFENIKNYEVKLDEKGKYRIYCEKCVPMLPRVVGSDTQ